MLRRTLAPLIALFVAVLLPVVPASAQSTGSGSETSEPPAAKAWILADADTGAILAALNIHEPYYVASLVKVMTAFVTLEQLQMGNEITVSPLAASQQPMRIGMEPGQRWTLEHALHSLLMVSANDAAYALAEAAGGDLKGFSQLMERTAERLGMEDSVWLDPAGFDGNEGFEGGSKSSAYDLAVLSRNALEMPELMAMAGKVTYEFEGGDGKPHTLTNHNKMLQTFPGLTGLKTGYTRAAGHTLIATAERDGRRLIAVIIDALDHYGVASALLNQGFNTPPDSPGTGEVLPPVSLAAVELPAEDAEASSETSTSGGGFPLPVGRLGLFTLFGLAVAFVVRREQIKRRKRRRQAMRRAYLDSRRRGMIEPIDADRYYGAPVARQYGESSHVQVVGPGNERIPLSEMYRSHGGTVVGQTYDGLVGAVGAVGPLETGVPSGTDDEYGAHEAYDDYGGYDEHGGYDERVSSRVPVRESWERDPNATWAPGTWSGEEWDDADDVEPVFDHDGSTSHLPADR